MSKSKEIGLKGGKPFRGNEWEGDHGDVTLILMAIHGSQVNPITLEQEKSLAKKLEERGYDFNNLNFSIRKKERQQ